MGNEEANDRGPSLSSRAMCARLWLCGIAVSMLASCGSETTPREQCLDYQNAICDKANECAEPSERADLSETCQFIWQIYSFCDRVRQVSPRYDACVQAIHDVPCSSVPSGSLPDTPDACHSVFAVDP
ncbi:MAG: hypothetical protein ABW061_09845 [Polyangiaceae bacterium]